MTHTPGPWFVGAQNDALFVVAGRAPATNNDHPWHDAPRVAVAKVFRATENDCLPVNPDANGRLMAAAPELLEALVDLLAATREIGYVHYGPMRAKADAAITKATGRYV